jgi:Sugar phosphate permease
MNTKLFNQNFIFLLIGQASSMIGTVLLKFTVSLLILDLTGSAALFGVITAISYLPPVFLSPIVGILADRKNKRNLMVALDSMYCVMAILLTISMSLPNKLIYTTIVMVILSIISSFETPVVQSSIPLLQLKENLVKSNAVVSQVNMIANLAGPLLAGVFYGIASKSNFAGIQMIFFSCAICFFFAAFLEIFIKIPKVDTQKGNTLKTVKRDLIESIHFLTTENTYVLKAILLNAAFVLLIQPLITTGAPFIIRIVLNLSPILNGLSQAIMAAAGLVGGIIAGLISHKFKVSRVYQLFLIMGTAIAFFGFFVLLNLSASMTYIVFVIIGAVIFISASIAGIFIISAIQQNVPSNMLGRIMSFYSAVVTAALPAGILIFGFLYEKFINRLPFILFATAVLIFVIGQVGKRVYKHL